MARILNKVAFSRQIQKIVETENGLIINGHYYNRQNMTPLPFSALPTYGSVYDLSMNQKLILKSTATSRNKTYGDMIVVDQNNPNIKYVFTVSTKGENIQCIIKLNEANGKCEHVNYSLLSGFPTTNGFVKQIAGQNDDFIYLLFETNGHRTYFYAMDKNSLTMTSIKDYGNYFNAYKLYETEENIYLGISNNGMNYIEKYNKLDKTVNRITATTNATSSLAMSTIFTDPIIIDEDHFYTYAIKYSNADAKISIIKFDFDLTLEPDFANVVTDTVVDTTFTDTIAKISSFAANSNIVYEPFITYANNSKKYLNIVAYETYASSTVANYPNYGVYTFLIDEDNNGSLILKNFTNFGNIPLRGFLSSKNNNTAIFASDQSLFFTNFSTDSESFVLSETKNVNPQHLGIDRQENVWYVNGNGEVDLVNSSSVNSVYMTFEKGSYTYDGSDISTYIEVCTKNIDGELIESTLQLTITGEATWNTNNTKTVNIVTSKDDVIQVPLTIKDKGNINILPKVIM